MSAFAAGGSEVMGAAEPVEWGRFVAVALAGFEAAMAAAERDGTDVRWLLKDHLPDETVPHHPAVRFALAHRDLRWRCFRAWRDPSRPHPAAGEYRRAFPSLRREEVVELIVLEVLYRTAAGLADREVERFVRDAYPDFDAEVFADRRVGEKVWPKVRGYELIQRIARGGQGVVYRARRLRNDHRPDPVVALKVLDRNADETTRERFRQDATLMRTLREAGNTGIVAVHEVDECDGCCYFTMDCCDASLAGFLDRHRADPSRDARASLLPPSLAARWGAEIARTIHRVHTAPAGADSTGARFIHRDLKPDNVLLQGESIRLTDFGLAKALAGDAGRTQPGQLPGTPGYMAPEQFLGGELSPATDVYGVGTVLYQMLTGRPPFSTLPESFRVEMAGYRHLAKDPSAGGRSVPEDLRWVCRKALEPRPEKRFATAGELADELDRCYRGEPTRTRPKGWLELAWLGLRERPALQWAGVSLLLLGLGIAALVFARLTRDREDTAVRVHLDQARTLADRAEAAFATDLATREGVNQQWRQARAEVDRASARAAGFGRNDWNRTVDDARAALDARLATTERDYRTLEALEGVASELIGRVLDERDLLALRQRLRETLAERLGTGSLPEAELVSRTLASFPSARIGDDLLAALDALALIERKLGPNNPDGWRRILRRVNEVDPDDWRRDFRAVVLAGSPKEDFPNPPLIEHLGRLSTTGAALRPKLMLILVFLLTEGEGGRARLRAALKPLADSRRDFWSNYAVAETYLAGPTPDPAQALGYYRVARSKGSTTGMLTNLGKTLLDLGHPDEAIPLLEGVCRDPAALPETWNTLGVAYARVGELEPARSAHREAIAAMERSRGRSYPEAQLNLAGIALRQRAFPEAERGCTRVLDDPTASLPTRAKALANRAAARVEARRAERGIEPWRIDLPLQVLHRPGLRPGLAVTAVGTARLLAAEADARAAIRLDPRLPEARQNLALVLAAQRQSSPATEELLLAVALRPGDPDLWHNLANLCHAAGNPSGGVFCCRVALGRDPEHGPSHFLLGKLLTEELHRTPAVPEPKRFRLADEAIRSSRIATRRMPDRPEAPFQLAILLATAGAFPEAHEMLATARRRNTSRVLDPALIEQTAAALDHFVALDRKTDGFLQGEIGLRSVAEWAELVRHHLDVQRYAVVARLHRRLVESRPEWISDERLLIGARVASMADAGRGRDLPEVTEAQHRAFREQILDFGAAALSRLRNTASGSGNRQPDRTAARSWLTEAELARFRDEAFLRSLPAEQRDQFDRMWRGFRERAEPGD